MITQTYNLNLIPDRVPVIVNCSQYDANSRTIEMTIYDGSVLYTIPSGTSATVRGTKQDNTGFEYPCTIDGSIVSFDIQDQMTIFAGKVPCEIRLSKDGGIIGTCNFLLNVEETPLDPDVTISETDLPLLEEAEQNAIRAENAADRAESLLDTKMDLVSSPTANNILLTDGNGQAVDGGKALADLQDKLTAGYGIQLNGATISNIGLNAYLRYIGNADLNTILESGTYRVDKDTNGANFPDGVNGLLIVAQVLPNMIRQIFFRIGTVNSTDQWWYSREIDTNSGVFGDWVMMYNSKSLTSGNGINITSGGVISNQFAALSAPNLDNITYNYCGYVKNATNYPSGEQSNGQLMSIARKGDAGDGLYTRQIFSPYNGNKLYMRYADNGTWSSWEMVYSPVESGNVTVISTAQSVLHHFYNIDGNVMTVGFKIQAPSGGFSNATTIFTLPYKAHTGGFVPVYVSSDTWLNNNVGIKYAFLTGGAATFQVSTIPANYWVMGYFTVIIDR